MGTVPNAPVPKSSQDRLGTFLSDWRNRVVAAEIEPPFLDIACGDNRLARSVGGGTGVDIVDYGTADAVVHALHEPPYPGGAFATVTIVASLNYFESPAVVLGEAARVLRPGGKLVITLVGGGVGRVWHAFREPWARAPGFSRRHLEDFCHTLPLKLERHRRFMLGLNHLYVLRKSAEDAPAPSD